MQRDAEFGGDFLLVRCYLPLPAAGFLVLLLLYNYRFALEVRALAGPSGSKARSLGFTEGAVR